MRHKNYFISLLLLLAALTASAQTCPGPANRTALINLQKSQLVNGTRWGQLGMTDTCGNQRYVTLDSIIVVIVDSLIADTTLQVNWYTTDGVTDDLGRNAFVKRTAIWRGLDSVGFIRFTMRPDLFSGTQFTLFQDSTVWEKTNTDNRAYLVLADTGILIATGGNSPQSVNVRTDTVNWSSSVDPALQMHNLLAEGTYFYADSLKVVGIGQFPHFPSIDQDGTEKGFFSDPTNGYVSVYNGNGISGERTEITAFGNSYYLYSTEPSGVQTYLTGNAQSSQVVNEQVAFGSIGPLNGLVNVLQKINSGNEYMSTNISLDEDVSANIYIGIGNDDAVYAEKTSIGLRTYSQFFSFDWLQFIVPDVYDDTTGNQLNFYNRAYYWKNEHPTGTAETDTLLHFWAATGPGFEAGSDPGFMTLEDIRGGADNWYNSNGTTTDNTRIATVRETATWLSDDVVADGVYPFRFQLTGGGANEPEMMVWRFPAPNNDSLTLGQSDQEVFFQSTNSLLMRADEVFSIRADSITISGVEATSSGDILCISDVTSPGVQKTVKAIEGTFNADVLSWSAGAAGDKWFAVPANRTSIGTTSASIIPAESTAEILIDGAGGGTVELNYTPAMPSAGYTTYRWIYNQTAAATTISTNQAWQFRDNTGDLGTSFSLAANTTAQLVWIYDATPANARFFVVRSYNNASSASILQNGNSFGTAVVIGSNDANALSLETNNTTRATVTGGASTGGAWTETDVSANTNTPETMYTSIVNSSGTAAAGFGMRHIYQLESSTTNAQDAGAMDIVWSDATHASRTGDFVFSTVASAAALAEAFRIGGTNYQLTATANVSNTTSAAERLVIRTNSTGTVGTGFGGKIVFQDESTTTENTEAVNIEGSWLTETHATRKGQFVINTSINGVMSRIARFSGNNTPDMRLGASGLASYTDNGISTSSNFSLSSSQANSSAISVNSSNATNTGGVAIGGSVTNTYTSGTKGLVRITGDYAPTSGTGVFYNMTFVPTINQTGGANGLTGGIIFEPVLTSVGASWSALTMATSNSSAKFLNQTGANTTSTHVGAFGIGSTTVPTDKLEVTGNLALLTAGNKIKIATGSNASVGVSGAMTAGTITISTTAVTANSIILLTHASVGGTVGVLSVGTITAGTSFVINSSSALDTSTVNWLIIN